MECGINRNCSPATTTAPGDSVAMYAGALSSKLYKDLYAGLE